MSELNTHQQEGEERPTDGQGEDQPSSPMETKIQELEAQLKEKEQKYVYLYADFENFKKRAVKERSDLLKFGWESSARQLLEVIDNLERALAHMPKSNEPAHKTLEDGLKMVLNQFRAVLDKQGVKPVTAEFQMFDPNLHEAVGQESSDKPQGQVIKEEMKGYTIHGRLLRPARVIISGGQSA